LKALSFGVEEAVDGVYVAGAIEAPCHADPGTLENGKSQYRGVGCCHFDGREVAGLSSFHQVIQA
jgi:hypothetical protein